MPSREAIDAALDAFRGTFMQQPPAFSAKKIDGQRSYKLARAARAEAVALRDSGRIPHPPARPTLPALPAPVSVTAHAIEIVSVDGDHVTLSVDCSAGFYVRSLAHDLGERLGVGAHLAALRRTRSGDFGLDRALDARRRRARSRGAPPAAMVPLASMLPPLAARDPDGRRRRPGRRMARTIRPGGSCKSPVPRSPQPPVPSPS